MPSPLDAHRPISPLTTPALPASGPQAPTANAAVQAQSVPPQSGPSRVQAAAAQGAPPQAAGPGLRRLADRSVAERFTMDMAQALAKDSQNLRSGGSGPAKRVEPRVMAGKALRGDAPRPKAGKNPELDPAARAQMLLAQVTRARQAIAQLVGPANKDPGERIGDLQLHRLSAQDQALVGVLKGVVDANLRHLNQLADQAAPRADWFPTQQLETVAEWTDLRTKLNTDLDQRLEALTPESLKQGGPGDLGMPKVQLSWEIRNLLRDNPEIAQSLTGFLKIDRAADALVAKLQVDVGERPELTKLVKDALRGVERHRYDDQEQVSVIENMPSAKNVAIGAELGRGGAGSVHEATFRGRSVVVKVAHAAAAADFLGNLVELTNQVKVQDDPNIPKVLGLFRDQAGAFCVVMEKVPGDSLDKFMSSVPPDAKSGAALHLFAGAVRGLATMHDRNLAHLDLKPANIMADKNSLDARLIDFGMVARQGSNDVDKGGSLQYMSPEQFAENPPHTASDIWALGVSLGEMCGLRPFEGCRNERDLLAARGAAELPFTDAQLKTLSPDVRDLVQACMARSPMDRPSARQITDALDGQAVRQPGPGEAGLKSDLSALDFLKPGGTGAAMLVQGRQAVAEVVASQAP